MDFKNHLFDLIFIVLNKEMIQRNFIVLILCVCVFESERERQQNVLGVSMQCKKIKKRKRVVV